MAKKQKEQEGQKSFVISHVDDGHLITKIQADRFETKNGKITFYAGASAIGDYNEKCCNVKEVE